MGYSRTQIGYCCFHPPTRQYFVSTDVTFFQSMHYSNESPPPVESVPLPSVVEPQDVDSSGTSTVHTEVSRPLQVYYRHQTTPVPLTTQPVSSAGANPPTNF